MKKVNIFNGKKVTVIDTSYYLMRFSGTVTIVDNLMVIKKGTDRITFLIDSFISVKKADINSYKIKLKNENTIEFIIWK